MIDFKTEIKKYQFLVELEEVEEALYSEEIADIVDLIQHMAEK